MSKNPQICSILYWSKFSPCPFIYLVYDLI